MHRWLLSTAVLAALLLGCPGGALALGGGRVPPVRSLADLDSRPIALTDVVRYHCHDLLPDRYRCFDTATERDADVAAVLGGEIVSTSPDALEGSLSALSVAYVLAYAAANYGGSSILLSAPTPDLGPIGWSNVISSFKSTNGGRPKWWENSNYTGMSWQWGTSVWVPYVGDDANDRFTSVKNVP